MFWRQLSVIALVLYSAVVHSAFTNEELFRRRDLLENGVIAVLEHEFHQFFNGPKRHHLVALFTTSNPKFKCAACEAFQPVYETISQSLITDHFARPIFLIEIEFEANARHFQDLNLNTVPHVWIYAPSDEIDEEDEDVQAQLELQLQKINVTSDHFVYQIPENLLSSSNELELHFGNFLSSILHINILIHKPFEMESFLKNFVIYLSIFVIIKKRGRKILDKFKSFHFYFILSTLLIFLSVSGYNFCIQRSVPFIAKNNDGGIMYFSGGTQYQFGLEMVNITSVYTLLTGLMVILVTFIPSIHNIFLQNILTIITTLLLFICYNLLNTIFLIKDPAYPFVQWKLF